MRVKIKKCPECDSQNWDEIKEEKYVYECKKCGYVDYKSQARKFYLEGLLRDKREDKLI